MAAAEAAAAEAAAAAAAAATVFGMSGGGGGEMAKGDKTPFPLSLSCMGRSFGRRRVGSLPSLIRLKEGGLLSLGGGGDV